MPWTRIADARRVEMQQDQWAFPVNDLTLHGGYVGHALVDQPKVFGLRHPELVTAHHFERRVTAEDLWRLRLNDRWLNLLGERCTRQQGHDPKHSGWKKLQSELHRSAA